MAVEFCSETTCVGAMSSSSPRISFSHDLSLSQTTAAATGGGVPPPIEQYIRSNSSSSSVDFDFCVFRESFDQEYSSSADELFFDGKILPIEIKKKLGTASKKSSPPLSPLPSPSPLWLPLDIDFHHSSSSSTSSRKGKKNENAREQNSNSNIIIDSEEKQSSSNSNKSSSWFKRSSSLNCGSGYARSLCPIPLLSRSNSTGSTPNVKRSSPSPSLMKDNNVNSYNYVSNGNNKQKSQHQKPPLKRSYTTSVPPYGNGVNPVLNVPTPTFFGLSSIFSTAKDKNKKK